MDRVAHTQNQWVTETNLQSVRTWAAICHPGLVDFACFVDSLEAATGQRQTIRFSEDPQQDRMMETRKPIPLIVTGLIALLFLVRPITVLVSLLDQMTAQAVHRLHFRLHFGRVWTVPL